VSEQACVEVARRLGVPERLTAAAPEGVGRNSEVLIESDRVLASVCEAIIGAAYLAFGFERVRPAVVEAFEGEIEDARRNPVDHKSVLQERLAQRSEVVEYRIATEEGPPHDRSFVAVAEVGGKEIGRGEGKTKKAAEQEAASRALDSLDLVELVMELEDTYGIRIPDDEAAKLLTVGESAEWIAAHAPHNAT
jgi:ribonuclease-3